jgi:Ca-activated chloride channel family protein
MTLCHGAISARSFFLAIFLLARVLVTAQTGTQLRELSPAETKSSESAPQTFSTKVREVNVLFSASDWRGRFVADLKSADVTVFDNGGQPESITYFLREENLPLEVGILIDVSGSVANVFHAQQKAASLFLQQTLRSSDQASLIAFGTDIRVVQDFTKSVSLLGSAIANLSAGDTGTAIFDAVRTSSERLAQQQQFGPNRRALVLITDGEDNASHGQLNDAIDAALQSEVVIFALNTNVHPESTDAWLKKLAESTGGNVLHASGEKALRSAFGKVNQQLRSQYVLGYKPSHLQTDRRFHRIRLTVHKFGLHVQCRKGYYVADQD